MQAWNTLKTTVLLATSQLDIVNPLRGGLAGLFSTHPATQERVARLRAMTSLELATA